MKSNRSIPNCTVIPELSYPDVAAAVDDVDAHCERAEQLGARIVARPTDHPFGERQYTAEDFAGRQWVFSQTIADVAPESWGGTRT